MSDACTRNLTETDKVNVTVCTKTAFFLLLSFSLLHVHRNRNMLAALQWRPKQKVMDAGNLVKNLSVTLNSSLSMHEQVTNTCTAAYTELRRISSICQYFTVDATKTLVSVFVLSRLDYCNALLSGVPQYLLDRLQRVQNAGARLTVKASKSDHITPILHSFHWPPVAARINYKVSTLCYSFLSDSGPEYLPRVLRIYTPSRQLRSSSDNSILCVPSVKTKTFGQRSFSYDGPVMWNKLPYDIRTSKSKTSFKQALKTHPFSTHY